MERMEKNGVEVLPKNGVAAHLSTQALLRYSNVQSELSLLDTLALGFYSDAEFFLYFSY